MKKAELPKNETERLQKLEEYNILDTLSEKEYEGIAKLASIIANTPISLISLIDKERQWFKSRVGLDVSETHRDYAFCAHAILEPKKIFQVPNAILDDRFVDNPLVTGDPNIRFYAGAPLVTSDNFSLGTLCVIDRVPRELTPEQEEGLSLLASQVIALLEERILLQKIQEQEQRIQSQFSELEFLYNSANCGYHALDANGTFLRINDLELEWLGETRENILNKRNFQDFIPENYFHFFKHSFERMKAEGKIDGVEATIIGANGKHIQISVNARAIYDENGNFLMSNATLIDITEKKALQLELEKSISLSFKKSEELQDQLKMAARIQKMILPIKSPLPSIRFFYKPLDEIGGDFFEFVSLASPDKVGILISDVAGHGVPSALITALLKSAINQSSIEIKENPAELLNFINEFIFDYIDNRFVTAVYGILDFKAKTLLFSNAGHPSPYILSEEKVYLEKQEGRSLPLGILNKSQLAKQSKEYKNTSVSLAYAKKILFYTDGLLEQCKEISDEKTVYFEDGLEDILENIKSKSNFFDLLLGEYDKFSADKEQMDDICLISVDL